MRHADIRDPLLHLRVRRHANQELELGVRSMEPEYRDGEGEDDGAHRINPPFEFGAADGGEKTEAIDEEVVAVVFP